MHRHPILFLVVALALPLVAAAQAVQDTDNPVPAASAVPATVPGWDALIAGLEKLPATTLAKLPETMRNDPQIQQEVGRLILQALALSTLGALGDDGDHPVFLPGIGELLNVGQPNADTIYRMAQITPGGTYRLRGNAGTLNMAVIGQVGPTSADPGSEAEHPGKTRNYLELSSVKTDPQGNFDILLSAEKPDNYSGEWWPLHPKTYRLMLRQVSSDWKNQQDPSIAIERLDAPASRHRPTGLEMENRLRRLPMATAFMANMFVDHVEQLRQQGFTNKFKVLDVSQMGGLDGQFYYEGAYDLRQDEALIIEARHPKRCAYRSLLLTNEIYQTTDWYNNQSSLNASQARVDVDGVLRVVVSERDPGVPNWLDTAGYPKGVVQGRWTDCDSQPIPTVTRVPVDQVRDHLPSDTPVVTPEQRDAAIRDRRAAYQLRRHW